MKVTINSSVAEKKLVAVLGETGGVFLPSNINGKSIYIGTRGIAEQYERSLSDLLSIRARTPVYEGDSVTIQF